MIVKKSGAGVLVASDRAEEKPSDPETDWQYFSQQFGRFGDAIRFLGNLRDKGADIVSLTRHGKAGGIVLGDDAGWLVTFRHHTRWEGEEKT